MTPERHPPAEPASLARSSLSIILRCLRKILPISGARGLNLPIKVQGLPSILRLLYVIYVITLFYPQFYVYFTFILRYFDLPVECIIEALEICLTSNCSTYCGQFLLQENGTAMGPKNSCSYADIVAEEINKQDLESRTIHPELEGCS